MATSDNATDLTIGMLDELGIINLIIENLDEYKVAIEDDVDGFLTLEELQTIINNVNSTSIFENTNVLHNVYPNPSNGIFNLNCNIQANVKVTNIYGKQILVTIVKNNNLQIDISNQPSGIYFIIIETENKTIINKISKF